LLGKAADLSQHNAHLRVGVFSLPQEKTEIQEQLIDTQITAIEIGAEYAHFRDWVLAGFRSSRSSVLDALERPT
jgi:hypothetical protein